MLRNKGITLISLVVTIIILLILAGIAISTLIGKNGLIAKAIEAKDETKINAYKEEIELTRAEVRLQKKNYENPELEDMKKALDEKEWKKQKTEIIQDQEDKGIEKLKLITKEEYIFYVTKTGVEYKGKGKIVDTTALNKEDVLELREEKETSKGKNVKITNLAEDYYKIKYQIDSEDGKWLEIKSGEVVEVPFGKTLYARLAYGANLGVVYKLKIEGKEPTIEIKQEDTSDLKRKTTKPLVELFDITWGSDGTGKIQYEITGKPLYSKSFDATNITSLADLELGEYTIKCTIISPDKIEKSATKSNVKIAKLATTTVTNLNNESIEAYGIYSQYDLVHFRNLVNSGNPTINGKMMDHVDLSSVCSSQLGTWEPIADYTNLNIAYQGTFDGNNQTIDNLYINSTSKRIRLVWKYR